MKGGDKAGADPLQQVLHEAWRWCCERDFAGHDPYDGLKSGLLAPVLDMSRLLRLAVIQGVKRSPVDIRGLLQIPPGRNAKGLALLLRAIAEMPAMADRTTADRLVDLTVSLASHPDGTPIFPGRDLSGAGARDMMATAPAALGWGYDFPWQSRAFFQPAFFPTVVCTSFVLDGLVAASTPAAAISAAGAARLVEQHLHRHEDQTGVCYSYSPGDQARCFNASLFGGKILARAAALVHDGNAHSRRDEAIRVVDYVVARQGDNGSWVYGEAPHWQWVDNLHTGFVLETIADIADLLDAGDRWAIALERGLAFYRGHLFGPDLTPWYYADRPYVLDTHTVAQAAITLVRFASQDSQLLDDARAILELGITGLYDQAQQGFILQRRGRWNSRAVFLRWSQAWMLRAIATCLRAEQGRSPTAGGQQ